MKESLSKKALFLLTHSDIIGQSMKRSDYLRQRHAIGKHRRNTWKIILAGLVIFLIVFIIFSLTPAYASLTWRVDELFTRIVYLLNPPEEAVFSPDQNQAVESIVKATLQALTPSPDSSVVTPSATMGPSLTPTITPTALPEYVFFEGNFFTHQRYGFNLCAPANLTMALKFWGWNGTRDDVIKAVKPGRNEPKLEFWKRGETDKNVMPYEMENYVNDETEFKAITRYGGEIELLKRFLANGFPVLIEKGYYNITYLTGNFEWMGHYLFVIGYDESKQAFIYQDTYHPEGPEHDGTITYSEYPDFIDGWRNFNYLFMVVYPPDREAEVFELMGPWLDQEWANRNALEIANREIQTLTNMDEFFAWFNKGTSHVQLYEYVDAAFAYDYAFLLYQSLTPDDTVRPYRMMWYQSGPYWAYYYAGRYQDVINLVNDFTFETVEPDSLEESLYWRGRAYLELGYTDTAIEDFRLSVYYNPNFAAGWEMLNQLGVGP